MEANRHAAAPQGAPRVPGRPCRRGVVTPPPLSRCDAAVGCSWQKKRGRAAAWGSGNDVIRGGALAAGGRQRGVQTKVYSKARRRVRVNAPFRSSSSFESSRERARVACGCVTVCVCDPLCNQVLIDFDLTIIASLRKRQHTAHLSESGTRWSTLALRRCFEKFWPQG